MRKKSASRFHAERMAANVGAARFGTQFDGGGVPAADASEVAPPRRIASMKRSHVLARELRGAVVVVLVAMMIFWLFAKLNDDRAEAKARTADAVTTTTSTTIAETTTTTIVDDNQRLCSLSAAFREDLSAIRIVLVNQAGDPLNNPGDLTVDVGMHADGDIPVEVREARTVASAAAIAEGASIPEPPEGENTTTTEAPPPTAQPSPVIVNTDRIDPLESGLLGAPQKVALNFYTAASALRLGLIDADFDASAAHFADMVAVAEPLLWDLEEIAASDLSDRWGALVTQPNVSVAATLEYVEEQCSIRIGSGFLYREKAPDLPILEQVFVDGQVDPGQLPAPEPAEGE